MTHSDTPPPFTHRALTEYQLTVANPTKVKLEIPMSSSACIEGSKAAGPFVTIWLSDTDLVTTDSIAHPGKAYDAGTFSTDLPAGGYKVLVSYYATSSQCGAMMNFSLSAGTALNSNEDDGINDDGGDSDDSADEGTLDTALVGQWSYKESDEFYELAHSFMVSSDAKVTQKILLSGQQVADHDSVLLMKTAGIHKRLDMKVTTIRVDETEEPVAVGDTFRCIYAINDTVQPRTLTLNCAESQAAYPTDWTDAMVFTDAGAIPLPPVPTPPSGKIERTLNDLSVDIPDNDETGISQTIEVTEDAMIKAVTIAVSIIHSYQGDLRVSLVHPDGTEVLLHNQTGNGEQNLIVTYGPDGTQSAGNLGDFAGKMSAGNWKLKVSDAAASDTGYLKAVGLTIHY